LINAKYKNNFNILRLILAILVFFYHWNILTNQNISYNIFHLGEYAVDIFFIVSGFLIFWSFDNNKNIKDFYIKRFFRIFPLYAFLVLLQTLFFVIYSNGTLAEIIKYFSSNIVFLNFLSPSVATTFIDLKVNAINGSLWTLKNEVIFYLSVPFLFMFYKKWGIIFLLILYSFSVLYMFFINEMGLTKLLNQFPAQLKLFIVGILFYLLYERINKKNIYIFLLFSVSAIIIFIENKYFKFAFYPILLGFIVIYLVYYIRQVDIRFDFSYSFYIFHFPVIQLAIFFGLNPSNPKLSFIVLFIIILFLSYLSEKYIEKRFVLIGKKIISNKQLRRR